MASQYDAHVSRLRLDEQDELRNEPERCSADPVMLGSIGRAVGQQVRIKRKDDPRFVALYTVKQANPPADVADPSRASVIRTGQAGRERLDPPPGEITPDEIDATVLATVVDPAPLPDDPRGVRFFEAAKDDGAQTYFIAIAPHGGSIERDTDRQAERVVDVLSGARFPASRWACNGSGDDAKGASARWHITSTDIHPACFPLLQSLMWRRFCYGVAFHGFEQKAGEADVYIGGAASPSLKAAVERALNRLYLPITVKVSTSDDPLKFQGFSPENLINRVADSGIHLEQSARAREAHQAIADAVAHVFASRWRFLVCVLYGMLWRRPGASSLDLDSIRQRHEQRRDQRR